MKTYSSTPGREQFKEIPCNLCGGDDHKHYLDCDSFFYVKCRECGMIYQNPQPLFSDLQVRYKDNYFQYEIENEKNFFNLMKLGLKDISFDSLTGAFKVRNFLDIGCATGMLINHMRDSGWNVRGVDICRESAEYGIKERALDIHIGPLDEAGYEDNYFSVVHFSHLIEHVPDPMKLLAEVKRILMPGGVAVITTPNADGFQAKLFGKNWRSAIADHVFLFTPKTLEQMLLETGFSIEKRITWGGLAVGTVPGFIKKPVDSLAKKMGFGDVMLFLVRKPSI